MEQQKRTQKKFIRRRFATRRPAVARAVGGTATALMPTGPVLKIMVLGGLEEVGRNMTVLEYCNDIIVIDMGLQFPEEDMPGIDYIINDISYFRGKEKNIRGVIITHGHYDHIGGVSHLIPKLGYPTIYTAPLTAAILNKRHEEFDRKNKLPIQLVNPDKEQLQLGKFSIEFFRVNHNIPDSMGVAVTTPVGTVVHTGDFKIDFSPVNDKPIDLTHIAMIGSRGVLALMSDSTDADSAGHQISEGDIGEDIEKIFAHAQGKIIVGTFASLINRVQQIIDMATKFNRRVYLDGRSMKNNVETAHGAGYLKIKPGTLVEEDEAKRLPANRLVVVGTGAQGEENAVLSRIANNEHKFLNINRNDTIIFSSSVVPGNERTIQSLKDTFCKLGAKVFHYKMMDIHAGGHAKQEDLKLMLRLIKPMYFIPVEANRFMLEAHANLAKKVGIPEQNIFVATNGQVIEFFKHGKDEVVGRLTKQQIPTEYIMVDGLGVGDVSNIVLRDRRMMSEDGMFVVIATVKRRTGELIGSPDIISRGFVYLKENKKLIEEARRLVKKICIDKNPDSPADSNDIKNKLREQVGSFLYKKTKRRPMVLPVVIEV
ncbi:MAG: ribonuclease J [Candidatus Falkowbacteria bacterium]